MLLNVPLMIVPFIVFNVVAMGLIGDGSGDPWSSVVLAVPMVSGARWEMNLGDLMVTLGLFLLFFEIMKATRVGASSVIDHLLSTFVLIAYLVEFLLVESAAHAVFFLLMMIALVDVIAGFSISIRAAARDVTIGDGI